jgi:hypothetical protein
MLPSVITDISIFLSKSTVQYFVANDSVFVLSCFVGFLS